MKPKFSTILHHLLALTLAGTFLLPLAWMIAASLRPAGLPPPRGIEFLHWPPTLDNYERIFEILPFARYIFNSPTNWSTFNPSRKYSGARLGRFMNSSRDKGGKINCYPCDFSRCRILIMFFYHFCDANNF